MNQNGAGRGRAEVTAAAGLGDSGWNGAAVVGTAAEATAPGPVNAPGCRACCPWAGRLGERPGIDQPAGELVDSWGQAGQENPSEA